MIQKVRYALIETPFRGVDWKETELNHQYTKACVGDSLQRGENPYASHMFFTQRGILDDRDAIERTKGIRAGKNIERAIAMASKYVGGIYVCTAVYTDRGISSGMQIGINQAKELGVPIDYRELGKDWRVKFQKFLESKDWLDLGLF